MSHFFRQKSMEHISSPEQLHDYMRVTSPNLWMLLTAFAALLIGFIVYACVATLENTIPVKAVVSSGIICASVPEDAENRVSVDMPVRIGQWQGTITEITRTAAEGTRAFIAAEGDETLSEGDYDAEIIAESIKPISFLLD